MNYKGTIYLDFNCVSRGYVVESINSPGLVRYILDSNDDLAVSLFEDVDRVYPNYRWSSPGNSMVRRLCGWILREESFPELHRVAERVDIHKRIQKVRDRMTEAFASRDFETHYFSDFPLSVRKWIEERYRVVLFSSVEAERRLERVLKGAVPEFGVIPFTYRTSDTDEIVRHLVEGFPDDPNCCFVISGNYRLGEQARLFGIRSILVDRNWVSQPYLEPGYGLNICVLSDFVPDDEKEQDYQSRPI